MRIRSLTPLALALAVAAGFCQTAVASSDDSCYPDWRLVRDGTDLCSNLPFLSPHNDSRVNLRLLLSDNGALPLAPTPLGQNDQDAGYGEVPFPYYRLRPDFDTLQEVSSDAVDGPADASDLNELLEPLGLTGSGVVPAAYKLLDGEGSRCRSNDVDSVRLFLQQLGNTVDLPRAEQQALAQARVNMLAACAWTDAELAAVLPTGVQSEAGQAFLRYLKAAGEFYSDAFDPAREDFQALTEQPQPWLKETARYMLARLALNVAQLNAFDEYGLISPDKIDRASLEQALQGFQAYRRDYPKGLYVDSALGLERRAHWLAGDKNQLARDYEARFSKREGQRGNALNQLVEEVDAKLLSVGEDAASPRQSLLDAPLLLAVDDLTLMRDRKLHITHEQLLAQKEAFAAQPALFEYLRAAFALWVDNAPAQALELLPTEVPNSLDYLAFSQQTLRALALQASGDLKASEQLWQRLLPLARLPLQREQIELGLALNYERSGQLTRVFAEDSPIRSPQVRYILLRQSADMALLRQQAEKGISDTERNTALFVLLYKELTRGLYTDFLADYKRLPDKIGEDKLGSSLGYVYYSEQTLGLFRWNGDKGESGYLCPSVVEIAKRLEANPKDPHGLNCLGEFVLRNGLDGIPLDRHPQPDALGSVASLFKGTPFSRQNGYTTVMADPKASHNEKAYALFRAVNCYAPSGSNDCGGDDVEPAVRKGWFRQLKSSYADTRWGKQLQYYW